MPIVCDGAAMPVVLDLDGDGLELVELGRSKARFDINSDGRVDRLGWVGRDDGLLVLDRNANGRIDSLSEFSFLQDFRGAGSDLEGLYASDSNGDGFLTADDERFDEFQIWRDRNGNGKSESNELFSLDELDITSISLERRNLNRYDAGEEANQMLATSAFERSDGSTGLVGDIALVAQPAAALGCGCQAPSVGGGRFSEEMLIADLMI